MIMEITVLENGTKVRIKKPGPGERGLWVIMGVVAKTATSDDPAYDVEGEKHGRRRIFRRSRMEVKRGT